MNHSDFAAMCVKGQLASSTFIRDPRNYIYPSWMVSQIQKALNTTVDSHGPFALTSEERTHGSGYKLEFTDASNGQVYRINLEVV